MKKKLALVAMLAVVGLLAAGCMGSSDRSARTAAIGSSTPVSGQGSLTFTYTPGGTVAAFAVQNWGWGMDAPATIGGASGAAVGKPQFNAFTIKKNIDNVSPTLYRIISGGLRISSMTFKVGTLLTYNFTNVYITGLDQSGSASDGNESVSFVYSQLQTINAASGTPVSYCFNSASVVSC